jgi:hypothetical protein
MLIIRVLAEMAKLAVPILIDCAASALEDMISAKSKKKGK